MSFYFTPLTDEQINAIQDRELLKDGIYPFSVKEIEEKISLNGNPMLKVKLLVLDIDNKSNIVIDYLLSTDKMAFKLKHFCEALGLEDKYLAGKLEISDCINRSGQVRIGVQKGKQKPDGTGIYPDRNIVKDYEKIDSLKVDEPFNDDIKF